MPENETEDIPPIQTEESPPDETSFEQRLETRIAELENRLAECEARLGEHGHDYAGLEHSHEQYSEREHHHETEEEILQEDNTPKPTHPYFRKLNEF